MEEILAPCWNDVVDVLASGVRRLLLFGPPGLGKTYAALRLATSGPAERLTCTEDLTSAEITGSWMPAGAGRWEWREGPGIRAWRGIEGRGSRLVVDEADRASGDALSTLLLICDSPESARWRNPETGEWVRPGEDFTVVVTTNSTSLEELPPALRDRFPVAIEIDRPHVGAVGALSEDLRAPALAGALGGEERLISLRAYYAFDTLRARLGAERAAGLVFGARAEAFLDALSIAALR
ncbi:MAG: AAA domain-containing protein [Acidimicrobiaceae bacterium]|nr:AAA domain-containing protein [Acidimicrobiaceae bacterium]